MQIVRIAIVLGVLTGFAYHLYLQSRKYLESPSTAFKEKVMRTSQFPDITICYPTYFNARRLKSYRYLNEVNYLKVIFQTNLKFLWELVRFNITSSSSLDYVQSSEYIAPAKLTFLPHMTRNTVGGGVQDGLMLCSYNREFCDFQNFTSFFDGTYGLCFQFSPSDGSDVLPGINNGLTAVIQGNDEQRIKFDDLYGGLNIFVHPRYTWPTSEKIAAVGQRQSQSVISYNYVSLKKKNTQEMPCKNTESQTLCRMEVPKGLVCRSYRETDGMRTQVRLQNALEEQCSCVSYEWPIPKNLKNRTACHFMPEQAYLHRGMQVSSTSNISILPVDRGATPVSLSKVINIQDVRRRYQCYINFKKVLAQGGMKTATPTLCNVENYVLSVFQGYSKICDMDYNDDDFKSQVKSIWLDKMLPNLKENNVTSTTINPTKLTSSADLYKTYIQHNGMQVNVFQNFITGVEKVEEALYGNLYFIADIGGVTGLWIGMSFITIFEIAEWIVQRLMKARKVNLASSAIRPNE